MGKNGEMVSEKVQKTAVFGLNSGKNELFRLGKGILFRVVGIASVDDGSFHVFVERMSVPKHDKFVVDAAFFIVRTKRNVKLVFV